MSFSYEDAVEYIDNINKFTVKNSLEHTKECLRRLGDPDKAYRYIHVAGTNGKGSTCSFMESVLRASGKKTGLFTSPHLIKINERFMIDGKAIDDALFLKAFIRIKELSDEIKKEGMYHPTYFEFLFLMGTWIFKEEQVEVAVFETGLGGRLDATNSLDDPMVSVITSVSFDHMKYLGDSLERIAYEKAGIIKKGVPCVFDDSCEYTASSVKKVRAGDDTTDVALGGYKFAITGQDDEGISFATDIEGFEDEIFKIRYKANWQIRNAGLAILALNTIKEKLNIKNEDFIKGIGKAKFAGRIHEIGKDFYIDGAHNEDGIRKMAQTASRIADGRKRGVIFAAMKDKDYQQMAEIIIKELAPDLIITVCVDKIRGTDPQELCKLFREKAYAFSKHDVEIIAADDTEDALRTAKEKKDDMIIFAMGSVYLAGSILEVSERSMSVTDR